jgi:hypothetical protein
MDVFETQDQKLINQSADIPSANVAFRPLQCDWQHFRSDGLLKLAQKALIPANHNLWFTQLKNQWRSKDSWIVEQLMNSANPVISLYAKVNRRIA